MGDTHTHTEREREALLEDGHDFEDDEDDVGIVRRLLLRRSFCLPRPPRP